LPDLQLELDGEWIGMFEQYTPRNANAGFQGNWIGRILTRQQHGMNYFGLRAHESDIQIQPVG
jgi:hypothetical protein